MLSILISILALGVIIVVHEAGHFCFARLFHVGVIEFSVGMGPVLLSRRKGKTIYSLRALPFGGSCMMLGEDSEAENSDSPEAEAGKGSETQAENRPAAEGTAAAEGDIVINGVAFRRDEQFVSKKPWQRFLIVFAGPLFNFVLAFLLSLILTAAAGWDRPVVLDVTENSPAMEAGLTEGCTIEKLSVNGHKTRVEAARDVLLFFTVNEDDVTAGNPISVTFRTPEGEIRNGEMTAAYDEESGRMLCGFSYSFAYRPCDGIIDLLRMSFYNVKYCMKSTFASVRMMIEGKVRRDEVMGVVGMVAVMDESVETAAQYGGVPEAVLTLLDLMILISGSLGLMNLLPVPALDGGRLVFILVEMITGKAVPRKIEGYIHGAGMILLLAFMVLILFNDVFSLMAGVR